MSSFNTNQKILLGSVIVASLSLAVYVLFNTSSSSNQIKDDDDNIEKNDNTNNTTISETKSTTKSVNEVVVEDDDDDDDDEEKEKENEIEKKKIYDAIYSVAKKRLDGKDYKNAALKFTELINLAPSIPSARKDLLILYNNRSVMYEKLNEFQESLSDITSVLAIDDKHIKARTRRARIYEKQGRLKDSLHEYVAVMVIERHQGLNPSNGDIIDDILKKVAAKESIAVLAKIRSSIDRPLPTKAYCRNFLETFPSQHRWLSKYKDSSELKIEIEKKLDNSKESGDNIDILENTLKLSSWNIANGAYSLGFQLVKECVSNVLSLELLSKKDLVIPSSPRHAALLSLQMEIYGTELHLKCNLNAAILAYQRAIVYNPLNFEASLKLASIHLEVGELVEAEAIYATILTQMNDESTNVDTNELDTSKTDNIMCDKAWVLLHRSTLWISRDEIGMYRQNACNKAIEDIDAVLNLTEKLSEKYPVAKAARLIGFLKIVHILSQTKAQAGTMVTEEIQKEDHNRVQSSIREAIIISPKHESVIMLQADLLSNEGDIPKAFEILDELVRKCDPEDSIPIVVKANILTRKAIDDLQKANGNQDLMLEFQQRIKDVEALYEKAIEIEPNGVEAMSQYASLKTMFGLDNVGCQKLVKSALENARTRDEVQELSQLLLITTAQFDAMNVLGYV